MDCSSEGIVGDFVPARAVTFELVAGQGFTTCIERDFVVWGTDVAEGFCSSCFVICIFIFVLKFIDKLNSIKCENAPIRFNYGLFITIRF